MVAQAEQLSGWPVSVGAGIPTSVWATTPIERRNSGGSSINPVEAMPCTSSNSLLSAVPTAKITSIICRL
ncbi:ash family protein [Citrobacter freundii]